jgi:hypothetical protein
MAFTNLTWGIEEFGNLKIVQESVCHIWPTSYRVGNRLGSLLRLRCEKSSVTVQVVLLCRYTLNTCMPACNKHKKRGK